MTYTLYTHSDQVLVWHTQFYTIMSLWHYIHVYCQISKYWYTNLSIQYFFFFFWKITCVCITKWYSVSPPFQYDCSENETLDISFQKRQTICFNLKSVSPGCIFQRLYQSHPFHIYIQVPVYEEIRILSQKKGKHLKESIITIKSKTKIRIFYHFRQTSSNNIPYLVLSDQHFCCIHS